MKKKYPNLEQFIAPNWTAFQESLKDYSVSKMKQKDYSKLIDSLILEMKKVWMKGFKAGCATNKPN